jgi:molybdopterin molybdotransferase
MSALRTVEQQRSLVLSRVGLVEPEHLDLSSALGATLRDPVIARVDIPPFDNSARDGFAVRFDDVGSASPSSPVRLAVVADLPAGSAADPALARGEVARIMTGSAVPTAADAIVPFEETTGGLADSLGVIEIVSAPHSRGAHIRRRGEDAAQGDRVLAAGIEMGPLQLAAAAAAGVASVTVSRRPRVVVMSTGAELLPPGSPLVRGRIPDSNGVLLSGLAALAGAEVLAQMSVSDEVAALTTAVEDAEQLGADVVLLSGGVSAGAYEVVRLGLAGVMEFVGVAMQPGKPQGFGEAAAGTLLFGLPGNPVSAAVSFEVFVRPALLAMQGRTDLERRVIRLPAAASWRTPRGRRQYLPALIDRTDPMRWTVRPTTSKGSASHLAGGLGRAEAYAVVPAEVDEVVAGSLVDVMLIT